MMKDSDLFDKIVVEVDSKNGIQIVTDNEASYVFVRRLLISLHCHLFWKPCVVHCLDLILKDISKFIPNQLYN